jgi:hypothetical protein
LPVSDDRRASPRGRERTRADPLGVSNRHDR